MTTDEARNIQKLYGITLEQPQEKPPAPIAPKKEDFADAWKYQDALRKHEAALTAHDRWESPHKFLQAGADLNALRHASLDGLRVVAWLAKYLEVDQDPLKLVVLLASEAGYDVDSEDLDWATQESPDGG